MTAVPTFAFSVPRGYGLLANTALQPWHYLSAEQVIDVTERWPAGPSTARLVAFARRQDNDDLACFEVIDDSARRIVVVHGWTPEGYAVVRTFDHFWDWLKAVIDDVAQWAEPPPGHDR